MSDQELFQVFQLAEFERLLNEDHTVVAGGREMRNFLKISKTVKLTSFCNYIPFIFKCFHDQQDS